MKTSKPLIIKVAVGVSPTVVAELQTKGHDVTWLPLEVTTCDLILGPTCARFLPGMEKFLESFIKGARAIRYKPIDKDKST